MAIVSDSLNNRKRSNFIPIFVWILMSIFISFYSIYLLQILQLLLKVARFSNSSSRLCSKSKFTLKIDNANIFDLFQSFPSK